jgi:hypothetical protein
MFKRVVVVALLILQQCLSLYHGGLQTKQLLQSQPYQSKIKFNQSNFRMNAAIPLRDVNIGSEIYRSTLSVRNQISFVMNAWKATIFVFVAIVGRFRTRIGSAVSSIEGAWKKRTGC